MSEFGQNPSITHSNFAPKVTKQVVSKIKSSKKPPITKTNNNKPLKVVYISNPMKFKVNADEFQALVQELTGRDAADWPYDNNYNNNNTYLSQDVAAHGGGGVSMIQHDEVVQPEPLMDDDDEDDHHQVVQVDGYDGSSDMSLDYFGAFDGDVVYGDGDDNNNNHINNNHNNNNNNNNNNMINMEYLQGFMSGDNVV